MSTAAQDQVSTLLTARRPPLIRHWIGKLRGPSAKAGPAHPLWTLLQTPPDVAEFINPGTGEGPAG